jgi:radical SAM protein with 4Fe4S-binding SPASM domain
MDFALFDRLMEEFAGNETATITLGGFGDPLMHPDFVRCLNRCREAGIFGLAVKTPAIHLNSEVIASLLANKVDVLHVILDAVTPEDYEALHGADHFDRVQENINKLVQAQRQSGGQTPLIVCEMMKIPQTMDKLEAFYDTWMGKTGGALLTGPSHHAGQWNDLSVMRMAPPARRTCGRIFQRVMILSDGTIPLCDQDFQGRHILGSLTKNALNSIWRSAEFENVRTAHQQGRYNRATLCPTCEEWHRP